MVKSSLKSHHTTKSSRTVLYQVVALLEVDSMQQFSGNLSSHTADFVDFVDEVEW